MVKKNVVEKKAVVKGNNIFKNDKHAILTVAVIVGVALIALNFSSITGGAITEPSSLTISQEGKQITVQVNYPAGKKGRPNNVVDMKVRSGTRSMDSFTKCDASGLVSRGSSDCRREIANFDLSGDLWRSGEIVDFSVRDTDVSRRYVIR
jgi:hypothetical protein